MKFIDLKWWLIDCPIIIFLGCRGELQFALDELIIYVKLRMGFIL
ncbi:hypothetical protein [Moraxella lacunata]